MLEVLGQWSADALMFGGDEVSLTLKVSFMIEAAGYRLR